MNVRFPYTYALKKWSEGNNKVKCSSKSTQTHSVKVINRKKDIVHLWTIVYDGHWTPKHPNERIFLLPTNAVIIRSNLIFTIAFNLMWLFHVSGDKKSTIEYWIGRWAGTVGFEKICCKSQVCSLSVKFSFTLLPTNELTI